MLPERDGQPPELEVAAEGATEGVVARGEGVGAPADEAVGATTAVAGARRAAA